MVHKTDHEIAIKVPILTFLHFTMYIQFLVQIKGAQMSMMPTISELKAMFTLLYTAGLSLTFWGGRGSTTSSALTKGMPDRSIQAQQASLTHRCEM